MKTFLAIIGFCVLFVFVAGTCAFCGDDDDNQHSMGRVVLVSHERDRCYYEDCGGDGGDGGYSGGNQGYGGGGGRSGDYDGGPGDDCRNACGNTIIVPTPGGKEKASLFPPTPVGIRDFVVNTTKAGLALGQAFADLTVKFVSDLLIGMA